MTDNNNSDTYQKQLDEGDNEPLLQLQEQQLQEQQLQEQQQQQQQEQQQQPNLSDNNNNINVLQELEQQIHQGIEAEFQLGWLYREGGDGVPRDLFKAKECWKRASLFGHVRATQLLRELKGLGFGCGNTTTNGSNNNIHTDEEMIQQGAALLAAKQASEHSVQGGQGQYYIGECFYEGKGGVEAKNYLMAVEWWKKAALNGHGPAMLRLGLCYRDGKGVEKPNPHKAVWYLEQALAASNGKNYEAMFHLAEACRFGRGHDRDWPRAMQLYETSAVEGNRADSQNVLGHLYMLGGGRGSGVNKNLKKGVAYWKMAAAQGHPDAQISLSMCYRLGWGLPRKDWYEAVVLLHNAIQNGCKRSGIIDLDSTVSELRKIDAGGDEAAKKSGNFQKALRYCCQHGLGSISKESEYAKQVLSRGGGGTKDHGHGNHQNNKQTVPLKPSSLLAIASKQAQEQQQQEDEQQKLHQVPKDEESPSGDALCTSTEQPQQQPEQPQQQPEQLNTEQQLGKDDVAETDAAVTAATIPAETPENEKADVAVAVATSAETPENKEEQEHLGQQNKPSLEDEENEQKQEDNDDGLSSQHLANPTHEDEEDEMDDCEELGNTAVAAGVSSEERAYKKARTGGEGTATKEE